MYKSFLFSLLLFSVLLSVSCDGRGYTVKGEISHGYFNGDTVYAVAFSGDSVVKVAGGIVDKGAFSLSGTVDSSYIALLQISHIKITPFVVEPGQIKMDIDDDGVYVGGTPLNDAFASFKVMKDSFDTILSGILRKEARLLIEGVPADKARSMIEGEFRSVVDSAEVYIEGFVRSHYDDVLGPFVLSLYCSGMSYTMLQPRMKALYDESPESFRNSHFMESLNRSLD